VSGAVEVSVWVDSGIVDVGAGSAGLFCECWVVDGAEENDWSSIGNVAAESGSITIGGGAAENDWAAEGGSITIGSGAAEDYWAAEGGSITIGSGAEEDYWAAEGGSITIGGGAAEND